MFITTDLYNLISPFLDDNQILILSLVSKSLRSNTDWTRFDITVTDERCIRIITV
jgi:hypothetical protein